MFDAEKISMLKAVRFFLVFLWATVSILLVSLLNGVPILNAPPPGRWVLTHVIDSATAEDQRILDYLLHRKSVKVFDELVILLEPDENLQTQLRKKGYIVTLGSRQLLAQALPTLQSPYFLVTSPKGEGVYAGAYTEKIQDLEIAQSYFNRKTLSNFPISGCGNSVRAQKVFDPQSLILAQRNEL